MGPFLFQTGITISFPGFALSEMAHSPVGGEGHDKPKIKVAPFPKGPAPDGVRRGVPISRSVAAWTPATGHTKRLCIPWSETHNAMNYVRMVGPEGREP